MQNKELEELNDEKTRIKTLQEIKNEIFQTQDKIKVLNIKLKKLHIQEAVVKYSKLFPVGKKIKIKDKEYIVKDYTYNYGFPTLRVARLLKDGTESKNLQDLYSYNMDDLYIEAVNAVNSKD